jgi:hypothetical protein
MFISFFFQFVSLSLVFFSNGQIDRALQPPAIPLWLTAEGKNDASSFIFFAGWGLLVLYPRGPYDPAPGDGRCFQEAPDGEDGGGDSVR